MDVTITKPCDVRLDGVVKVLAAWTRLNLPDDKARKLIDAGFAEQTDPAEEVRALVKEFGDRSPGGDCWNWIKSHQGELWRSHMAAFRKGNLSVALETFNQMIHAWEHRGEYLQSGLAIEGNV